MSRPITLSLGVDETTSLEQVDTAADVRDAPSSCFAEILHHSAEPAHLLFPDAESHHGGEVPPPRWWSDVRAHISDVHLFKVRDGWVLPASGVVVRSNGDVMRLTMAEAVYASPDLTHLRPITRSGDRSVLTVPGDAPRIEKALVVLPHGAVSNYGHFLLDGMASLAALSATGAFEDLPDDRPAPERVAGPTFRAVRHASDRRRRRRASRGRDRLHQRDAPFPAPSQLQLSGSADQAAGRRGRGPPRDSAAQALSAPGDRRTSRDGVGAAPDGTADTGGVRGRRSCPAERGRADQALRRSRGRGRHLGVGLRQRALFRAGHAGRGDPARRHGKPLGATALPGDGPEACRLFLRRARRPIRSGRKPTSPSISTWIGFWTSLSAFRRSGDPSPEPPGSTASARCRRCGRAATEFEGGRRTSPAPLRGSQ